MVQVAQAKHQELGPYLDLRTQQMQQTATYIKQKKFAHAIEQLRLARKAKKELPDSASRSEKDEVDNLIRSWQQITNNWKKEMDTLETENAAGNRHSGKRKACCKRKNNAEVINLQESGSSDDRADDSSL